MQRGATWGIVGIIPDECLQTPRFASTGFTATVSAGRGLRRHRGRRARASPSPWASRSGFTVTAGVTRGRHHHDDGAVTRASYFTIGHVPFLAFRSDRYRPSRAPVSVPAVARFRSQELTDPGAQN